MGRDMESQMESELLELKMEREHLQRTVSLLMECVSQLNTQLEEEKEKNGKAWKENCRKLRTLDTELAEKDAVIGQLSWDQDQESGDAEQHQNKPQDNASQHQHQELYPHSFLHSIFSSPSPSVSLSVLSLAELPRVQSDLKRHRPATENRQPADPSGQRQRRGQAPPVELYTGEKTEEQLDNWLPTLKQGGK